MTYNYNYNYNYACIMKWMDAQKLFVDIIRLAHTCFIDFHKQVSKLFLSHTL